VCSDRQRWPAQVLADPAGRLVWASSALPGARHDLGAAREHGLIDGLNTAEVRVVADTAYQGGGPAIRVPQRRRRVDPDTGRLRRRSRNRKTSTLSTPASAVRESVPMPNSSPGRSSAGTAAAPAEQHSSSKP
jgi:hypothetical protein